MTQKEKTFLDQTAQRLHLTVDGESSILFGSVGGYQTMLWRNDQGLAAMTLSLHRLGQEPDQSAIRQFVKGTRLVTGVSVRRSRVELTLNVRFGNPNQVEKLAEAVAAVVEFLHASGYDNCCQNCGSAVETDPCIMTGVPSLQMAQLLPAAGPSAGAEPAGGAGQDGEHGGRYRGCAAGFSAGRGVHRAAGPAGLCGGSQRYRHGHLHHEGL